MQFLNFLVQLLFKYGFYLRAAYMHMQCSESAKLIQWAWHDVTCTVKAKPDFVNVTDLFQNGKQTYWHAKRAVFFFWGGRVVSKPWHMCNLSFGESVASIWVRLLYTTLQCTVDPHYVVLCNCCFTCVVDVHIPWTVTTFATNTSPSWSIVTLFPY